jgi:predicted HTH transcriptional regulator
VRVGSSNRLADKELIAELRRFASGDSYDEEPLPDLDSEAIDFRAASELFASKRKLKKADLDTLHIVTKHQGRGPIRVAFFDDRLEVENPGLLPFGLTVQDMREGVSRLRNRVEPRDANRLAHYLIFASLFDPGRACLSVRSQR